MELTGDEMNYPHFIGWFFFPGLWEKISLSGLNNGRNELLTWPFYFFFLRLTSSSGNETPALRKKINSLIYKMRLPDKMKPLCELDESVNACRKRRRRRRGEERRVAGVKVEAGRVSISQQQLLLYKWAPCRWEWAAPSICGDSALLSPSLPLRPAICRFQLSPEIDNLIQA